MHLKDKPIRRVLWVQPSRLHMQAGRLRYKGGRARHADLFQHRRYTTISLECHFPLLPLGKSRRARPDVAFRGRASGYGDGDGWHNVGAESRDDLR